MRKVLVVLVALALAGCGSADGDGGLTLEDPRSTSSVQPVETTQPEEALDPEAAVKAEIVAAYRQSYDAFVAVGTDPEGDEFDPRLSEHTVGNALLASQLTIRKMRAEGQVFAGTYELHPEVVELTADTAVVRDCSIDQTAVVDQETGSVVTPGGPAEGGLATATYRLVDGVWMQNGFTDENQSCVPGT